MDIFIKLPIELQKIVMEKYFKIKHYEKMKLIKKELPEKSYRINKCFTINLSLYQKVFFTSNYLYKEECIRALKYLANCECCKRHQKNKPNQNYIIEEKKLNYPFRDFDNETLDCTCPCRHLSRWIIRGYHENYDIILVSLRNLP